jgi:adenylate cyclase
LERKLAAILAADVAGYSRLMGLDEERTLRSLRMHRTDVVDPAIAAHRGRIANTAGDSLLVEFPSVVDAVRCAVAIQQGMAALNADVAEDERVVFRMGINVGDVMVQGHDLLGDGINIAARLEQISQPGSVYVARVVRDQVQGRVPFEFEGLGPQQMKNIAEPVEVWRIRWEGGPSAPHVPASAAAPAAAAPAGDARPGVAVLPFANLSDDKEQEYFSDGLTEDLITDLSHFSQLRVIARNSTFRYKGQAVDIAKVGKELGVRYVLEGSVRRAGEQVRITAQLIDAQSQGHVWAQRYDRPQKQLFDVQDELIRAIVSTLVGNVLEADFKAAAAKPPHSLSAYELTLLGRRYMRVASTGDNLVKAHDAFQQAIAADPGFGVAYRGLAQVYMSQALLQTHWKGQPEFEREAAMKQALVLASKAVELHPGSEHCHAVLGAILAVQGRAAEGIASAEHGVALNPNNPDVHVELGIGYMVAGRHGDAIHQFDLALQLDPFPGARVLGMRAWALFMAKRHDEALESAHRSIALSPQYRTPHTVVASVYVEMNDLPKARAAMAKVLEVSPGYNLRESGQLLAFQRPEDRERWARTQHLAGMAE